MSDKEQKRLEELTEIKKSRKLNSKEFSEFKKLQKLCKGGKAGSEGKEKFVPGNDFSWWNKIPELIEDASNFKSNFVPGRVISNDYPFIIPGVIEVGLETCYKACVKATDPVNVWARDLYLRMFQKYRAPSSYSASDLGIAIFAGLEAVKVIACYERMYGVINRYSAKNVNMPLVEAAALGLTPAVVSYLQGHMSDFRYDLNYLIRKAQRLCLPKDISFIADAISLFGYEYMDHDSPKAQMIFFTLQNYGVYSDTALSTGGSITFNPFGGTWFDFNADNMCFILDAILNALLGSDSIQRIYADLNVWFGEEAMLQFLPVPDDYVVVPTYSTSILHKLHNSVIGAAGTQLISFADGALNSTDNSQVLNGAYHIYQVDDRIVTAGGYKDYNAGTAMSVSVNGVAGQILGGSSQVNGIHNAQVIDGYEATVSPEFVVEASLLKVVTKEVTDGTNYARVIESSVAYVPRYISFLQNTQPIATSTFGNVGTNGTIITAAGFMAYLDWAPLCYYITNEDQGNELYGDLDVLIPVNSTQLDRVHRATFLSGITTGVTPIKN